MLKIIKVTGNSLSPFFLSGDYVFISTNHSAYSQLRPGSTVVFNHPDFGQLIKRVHTNYPESQNVKVTGINKDSISSHKLGLIPYSDIIGKVKFHIKQPRKQSR